MFLKDRCTADADKATVDKSNWNHEKALNRANRVATEFSSPKLKYFDSNVFWGSWKWIGGFATDYTIVGFSDCSHINLLLFPFQVFLS